jgi:uncharacterized membrane protein
MKETKKSLKLYFLITGIFAGLSTIYGIFMSPDIATVIVSIVFLTIPVMFVYYGIKMYYFLQKSPKTLINFTIIAFAVSTLIYLLSGEFVNIFFAGLVAWYLIHSIKNISSKPSIIGIK